MKKIWLQLKCSLARLQLRREREIMQAEIEARSLEQVRRAVADLNSLRESLVSLVS